MKHIPKTSTQFAYELAQAQSKRYTEDGARAGLVLSILILYDMWGFEKEDIENFLKQYEELYYSYCDGKEDVKLWLSNIKDEVGIDIVKTLRRIV